MLDNSGYRQAQIGPSVNYLIKFTPNKKLNLKKTTKSNKNKERPETYGQTAPLIYVLNLYVKGLQIFMRRILPKRASDLHVESD